jgi:hypothetical protein
MDGGRTHRGPQRDPPPVLKTGEPTGTQPLPRWLSIPHGTIIDKIGLLGFIRSGTVMIAWRASIYITILL